MKQNTRIFDGLFDKFGEDASRREDILAPIKRELERFLVSRQKSRGQNVTSIASDYGVPTDVWEKGITNLRTLEQIIVTRIQQLDPRCQNTTCKLAYKNSAIVMDISLTITPPWQREPIIFTMNS